MSLLPLINARLCSRHSSVAHPKTFATNDSIHVARSMSNLRENCRTNPLFRNKRIGQTR